MNSAMWSGPGSRTWEKMETWMLGTAAATVLKVSEAGNRSRRASLGLGDVDSGPTSLG